MYNLKPYFKLEMDGGDELLKGMSEARVDSWHHGSYHGNENTSQMAAIFLGPDYFYRIQYCFQLQT